MILQLLAAAVVGYLAYFYLILRRRYPRGPTPYPFIGNLPQLNRSKSLEYTFRQWADEYGPVYTVWVFMFPLVTVNDYEPCVRAFVKNGDNYTDRMTSSVKTFDAEVRGGNYGITATSGELWREQRRFALRTLRDFGLGKNQMQDRILEEIPALFNHLDTKIKAGEHVNFFKSIAPAVGSVINLVLVGYRFNSKESVEHFYELSDAMEQFVKDLQSPTGGICTAIPILRRVPWINTMWKRSEANNRKVFDFMDEQVTEHEKTVDYTTLEEPRDFVDAYLMEMQKLKLAQDEGETIKHYFSRPQLVSSCVDLWMAGQGTLTTTMNTAIAVLITQPEIQERVHAELDKVIGSDRLITVSDRPDLPYLSAVINETQRYANLLPNNGIRIATNDADVEGHHIPAGTPIYPQISAILVDSKIFPEPKKFRPERFIDADGQFHQMDEMVPFSIGRRQCAGEGLARMELFLFMANLLNRYSFHVGDKPIDLSKETHLIIPGALKPFDCEMKLRCSSD